MVTLSILLLAFTSSSYGTESNIDIYVDGTIIETDQEPYIRDDRTLVPIRFVTEALGADVDWDGANREVTIERDDNHIVLEIDNSTYTLNGEAMEMDTAPELKGDRTMVPLRFVSEDLGEKVDWDGDERRVDITSQAEKGDDGEQESDAEEPAEDTDQDHDSDSDQEESTVDEIKSIKEDISETKALVTASTLNVRSDPGVDKDQFDQVHEGDVFQVLERHTIDDDVDYKEWIKINLSGDTEVGEDSGGDEIVEGWVSSDFVRIIEPKEDLDEEPDEEGDDLEDKEKEKDDEDEEDGSEDWSYRPVDDDPPQTPEKYSNTIGELTIGVDRLNVRKGPGLEYQSIDQVNEGETYPIITKSTQDNHPVYDEWIKLKLDDNKKGWSAAEYIESTSYDNDLDQVDFIEYSKNDNHTEIVVGAIKRTAVDDFTMDNPDRFVFDLKDISHGDEIQEEIEVGSSTVKKIRTGFMDDTNSARIALDLNKNKHYTVRWQDANLIIRTYEENPLKGTRIILDPGHGGSDDGAESPGGLKEKDVVLDVSLKARDILEDKGAEVRMTRETDTFISLDQRVDFATENNGDVFVSVHANAHPSRDIKGTETFYSSNRSSQDFFLASDLQNSLLNNLGTVNRGVKDRNFRVIRYATMPAALVEIAFLTNEEDEKLLKDDDFLDKAAEGIVQGLMNYHRTNMGR